MPEKGGGCLDCLLIKGGLGKKEGVVFFEGGGGWDPNAHYGGKRERKIDLRGAPKKTKQNKVRRCNSDTHLISFLAEVVDILHRI